MSRVSIPVRKVFDQARDKPLSRIFFFIIQMDYKHFKLIFRLVEFTRKIENSANLLLNVNNCD